MLKEFNQKPLRACSPARFRQQKSSSPNSPGPARPQGSSKLPRACSRARFLQTPQGLLARKVPPNSPGPARAQGSSSEDHRLQPPQGLLARKVPAAKITVVRPAPTEDDNISALPGVVEDRITSVLKDLNIRIFEGFNLVGLVKDNRDRLSEIVLEDATGMTEPRQVQDPARDVRPNGNVTGRNLPECLLSCRLLITGHRQNVDPDIYESVHGNGLVYDGAIIVDTEFKTIDDRVYAAGPVAEFSRRVWASTRTTLLGGERDRDLLRHDGYNGTEVGQHLAHCLTARLLNKVLPDFSWQDLVRPTMQSGLLPGGLRFYHVSSPRSFAKTDAEVVEFCSDSAANGFCRLQYAKVSSDSAANGFCNPCFKKISKR